VKPALTRWVQALPFCRNAPGKKTAVAIHLSKKPASGTRAREVSFPVTSLTERRLRHGNLPPILFPRASHSLFVLLQELQFEALVSGRGVFRQVPLQECKKPGRFRSTTSNLVELRERAYHSVFHQEEGGSPWNFLTQALFRIGN
jgi:hypothetical protein